MTQELQRSRTVPDPSAAVAALRDVDAADPLAALVHLLTPCQSALGLQVHLSGGLVWFRGRSAAVAGDDLPLSSAAIAALVREADRPGDTYVTLPGHPPDWVGTVRSGAHVYLTGARELFGGPVVRLTPAAAAAPVLAELRVAVAARRWPKPGLQWGGGALAVHGDSEALTLSPLPVSAAAEPTREPECAVPGGFVPRRLRLRDGAAVAGHARTTSG